MQNKSLVKNLWTGIRKRMGRFFSNPYSEVNVNWFKLKYYKHLQAGKLRKHRLAGKWLYFYSSTELLHMMKEVFIEKVYFQPLPPEPFIIDCGANIGLSVIYLKTLSPGATIIAFEPDEKNFELLSKNIEARGYTQVTLRQEAVWIENTQLHFTNDASMSSRIDDTGSPGTRVVNAVRLRDLITRKIDFLKIDIEGAEYAVLCDIADKLHHVENLFLEYHGLFSRQEELTKLFSILSSAGFSYYIKEATNVYPSPFTRQKAADDPFDVQLNIFCFRET